MIKKITLTLLLLLLLTSCTAASNETATSTPVVLPTLTSTPPPTSTPLPTVSPTAAAPACNDGAVLIADVTYPDNARLTAGEQFTKTWKLQNKGDCTWTGYTVAFVSGDRMEAPDSVPVPEVEAQSMVDVSVDLVAPSENDSYTANFELRNAAGQAVPMGTEPTFWAKIIVGEERDLLGVEQSIGNCAYTEKPEYVQAMIDLINKTRDGLGRRTLTVNDKLTTAAQAHSLDMACSGEKFLLHSGSNGSWTGERLAKAGYNSTYYFELLGYGFPQDALNEWRRHENQWPAVIDPYVTEIGVGYVFSELSTYGGYWTVVMAKP